MFEHAHVLEIAFLCCSIIGLSMSVWGVASTAKDTKIMLISKKQPNPLEVVTLNRLYQEAFRLAIHSVALIVAATAVSTPPPPPDFNNIPQIKVAMFGWLIVVVLLMVKEILDRRERIMLENMYDTFYGRRSTDPDLAYDRRVTDKLYEKP